MISKSLLFHLLLLLFYFQQIKSATTIPQLRVVRQSEPPIILDGVVDAQWDPDNPKALFVSSTTFLNMYTYLTAGFNGSLVYDYNVVVNDTSVCDIEVENGAGQMDVNSSLPATVLHFTCHKEGNTTTVVTLSLEGYEPLRFGFWKNCSGADPLRGFMMNTSEGVNVAYNGMVSSLFAKFDHDYKVKATEDNEDSFYAWTTKTDPANFTISSVNVDETIVKANYSPHGILTATQPSQGLVNFTLQFKCISNDAKSAVTINLDLGSRFAPISIFYYKDCTTGTWSSASIALFVAIGCVGSLCLGFLAYRFVKLGIQRKRGEPVEPFFNCSCCISMNSWIMKKCNKGLSGHAIQSENSNVNNAPTDSLSKNPTAKSGVNTYGSLA